MIELFSLSIAGLATGWILRGIKYKDPSQELVEMAKVQIEAMKDERDDAITASSHAREKDREAWTTFVSSEQAKTQYWQERFLRQVISDDKISQVSQNLAGKLPEEMSSVVNEVMEGPDTDRKRLKQALLEQNLTSDEADAILDNRYDDMSPSERVDSFVSEAIRADAGLR